MKIFQGFLNGSLLYDFIYKLFCSQYFVKNDKYAKYSTYDSIILSYKWLVRTSSKAHALMDFFLFIY